MNTNTKFTSTGRAVTSYSQSSIGTAEPKNDDIENPSIMEKELTLEDALNSLQQDETKGLVPNLLANLSNYFERFN